MLEAIYSDLMVDVPSSSTEPWLGRLVRRRPIQYAPVCVVLGRVYRSPDEGAMPLDDSDRELPYEPYIPPEVPDSDLRPRWLKWVLSGVFVPLVLTIQWINGFPDIFVRVDLTGQILMVFTAAAVVAAVISLAWLIETAVEMIRTLLEIRRSFAEWRRWEDDRA